MTPDLANDKVLLDLVAKVIDTADPVPPEAVATAKAVAGLQYVDAELANLVADSLLDDGGALLRHDLTMERLAESTDRMISFATPQIDVDIELHRDGRTVVGAITPPISVDVDLETTSGNASTRSDELGRFHLESGSGTCRLRIHAHDGTVITPWITR